MKHAYQRIQRLEEAKDMLLAESDRGHEIDSKSLFMLIAEAQIATAQALTEIAGELADIAKAVRE